MARKWRRKPLKSLKTDSEMASRRLNVLGPGGETFRFAAPQHTVPGIKPAQPKKWRKSALKPLISLAGVNLCAT
jgi:hypothetical protein